MKAFFIVLKKQVWLVNKRRRGMLKIISSVLTVGFFVYALFTLDAGTSIGCIALFSVVYLLY